MEQIIRNLYVGGDQDYERLKSRDGWSWLRCCKEGPDGHRQVVGYTTQAAPNGKDYLAARRGKLMALNFIDPHDPNFIKTEMVRRGLEFIAERLADGDKVLVACNKGCSRGPGTVMLYLRSIGELPGYFVAGERVFRALCPQYDAGIGMRQFIKAHWTDFQDEKRKEEVG